MELWATEINKKKSGKYRQDMVSVLVTILLILASVGTGGYLILRELLENVFGRCAYWLYSVSGTFIRTQEICHRKQCFSGCGTGGRDIFLERDPPWQYFLLG